MGLFVDDAQIEHRQMPTLDLDVINKQSVPLNSRNSFLPGDSRNHSGGI